MSTFVERINSLVTILDERVERERKAKEIEEVADRLTRVNQDFENIIWAYKFMTRFETNKEMDSAYGMLLKDYSELRGNLVRLWAEESSQIDVLEPKEFFEPLDKLLQLCGNLEETIKSLIRTVIERVDKYKALASTLAIIPDIKVDLKAFDVAKEFLVEVGFTARDIANFIKKDQKILEQKVKTWLSHKDKIIEQQKRLDLENLKSKGVSDSTLSFLKSLIEDEGQVEFTLLTGQIVEELKAEFPELSKRLRLSIY